MTNGVANLSHPFHGGGYMLAASYWPKDRVMINRLDSICQAVLKGKWPGSRRVYEGSAAVSSFYTTKLMDNAANLADDPAASPQGSKVKKHDADREKEFSVKINDVCSFKFSHLPTKMPSRCGCCSARHASTIVFIFSLIHHAFNFPLFCSFNLHSLYLISRLF